MYCHSNGVLHRTSGVSQQLRNVLNYRTAEVSCWAKCIWNCSSDVVLFQNGHRVMSAHLLRNPEFKSLARSFVCSFQGRLINLMVDWKWFNHTTCASSRRFCVCLMGRNETHLAESHCCIITSGAPPPPKWGQTDRPWLLSHLPALRLLRGQGRSCRTKTSSFLPTIFPLFLQLLFPPCSHSSGVTLKDGAGSGYHSISPRSGVKLCQREENTDSAPPTGLSLWAAGTEQQPLWGA